jgi:predicted ATPase
MTDDPLLNLPEQERLVFEAFTRVATGRDYEAVVGAAVNVLINVIRQTEPTRADAEAHWNELVGRGKTLLLDHHYDSVTGKRRNVFPHTQVVRMSLVDGSGDR